MSDIESTVSGDGAIHRHISHKPDKRAGRSVVLLVDDHPIVRRGMALLIERAGGLVIGGEASTGEQALRIIEHIHPDLVLIDICLPDMTGIELMRRLSQLDPVPRMLVLSMYDESLYAQRVMQAGALGFVSKSQDEPALMDAIQTAMLGTVYISQSMAEQALARRPRGRSHVGTFSQRELEVFELLGQGQTTQQIATRLGLSSKTIDTYREHLKHKLRLANSAELVQHAVQWVLEGAGG